MIEWEAGRLRSCVPPPDGSDWSIVQLAIMLRSVPTCRANLVARINPVSARVTVVQRFGQRLAQTAVVVEAGASVATVRFGGVALATTSGAVVATHAFTSPPRDIVFSWAHSPTQSSDMMSMFEFISTVTVRQVKISQDSTYLINNTLINNPIILNIFLNIR